ncbi:MAG: phage distal tail protein [Actinomycetes bacterium]
MPILTDPLEVTPTVGPGVPGTVLQRRYATLGDLSMGLVDPSGTKVYLVELTGWDDGVPTTGESEQRVSDHGAWVAPAYLEPRVIGITLHLVGGSFRQVSESLARVVAAVPVSHLDTLTVDDHGVIRQAQVRQEGEPVPVRKGAAAKVSLSLVAPDPRKYAPNLVTLETGLPSTAGGLRVPFRVPARIQATTTAGILSAVNDGTFETRPTLIVYGPVDPFRITHRGTGRVLRFHEPIPAGRYLEIDTDKKTALLDGTATRRLTGAWFAYAPGVNEVGFSADTYNPGARLVSEHRNAWR